MHDRRTDARRCDHKDYAERLWPRPYLPADHPDKRKQPNTMEETEEIQVLVADASHERYVDTILQTIADAAKVRGTGIARRTHEYLATKMREVKAVIALAGDRLAGFSYIETWGNKQYVTTSGLIVHPDFRHRGVAKRIKDLTFTLARTRWPHAKIFSLTSGAAVMTMNTQLGYQPVTFADLTDDEAFWKGCEGCVNVDVLHRTGRKYCICTAMLYDPEEHLPAKLPQEVLDRIRRIDAPGDRLAAKYKDGDTPSETQKD